jgi:hypothetical protein
MAEPVEDKGLLSQKLEEDRQKMAVQVGELKEEYDVLHRINASVQKTPLPWVIAALLVGFLLSRLPARRKEVLVSSEPLNATTSRDLPLPSVPSEEDESFETKKFLSLARWVLGAYLIREFDRCIIQPGRYVAERIIQSDLARKQTERYLHELQNWIEKHGQSLPSLQDRLNRKNSFLRRVLHRTPFEKLIWQIKAKPHRFWEIFS